MGGGGAGIRILGVNWEGTSFCGHGCLHKLNSKALFPKVSHPIGGPERMHQQVSPSCVRDSRYFQDQRCVHPAWTTTPQGPQYLRATASSTTQIADTTASSYIILATPRNSQELRTPRRKPLVARTKKTTQPYNPNPNIFSLCAIKKRCKACACLVLLMPASCVPWPSTTIAPAPAPSFPGERFEEATSIEEDGIGAAALSDGTKRDTCFRMMWCSSLFVTPDLDHHRDGNKTSNRAGGNR